MKRIYTLLLILATSCFTLAADPLAALQQSSPALHTLYQAYPSYHQAFADYANRQGFRRPIENLATVVHEIIHIDSLVHQGYFIDGTYYEPYLRKNTWPNLTNEQVRPHVQENERGVIYQFYAINTPRNNLGNLIDEINAYTHVLPYICHNEPESTEKQVKNLIGFLYLTEAHLRTLRTTQPVEYTRFSNQKEARGAFTLVIQRSWKALTDCKSQVAIPSQEAAYFISQK